MQFNNTVLLSMAVGWLVAMPIPSVASQAAAFASRTREAVPRVNPQKVIVVPARAGWYGPEAEKAPPTLNSTLEQYGPKEAVREAGSTWRELATPDLRVWSMLGLTIIGARLLLSRKWRSASPATATSIPLPMDRSEETEDEKTRARAQSRAA